jgi:8-oxo-dGTP pyrophosphatase MutT (NUDIX family)
MAKPQPKSKTRTKKRTTKGRVSPRTNTRGVSRHRQYGVIPVRFAPRKGFEILLVTSRGTGRWVIPKGWPMRNRTPAGTARREAYEEAGVKGQLWSRQAIGSYRYTKRDEKFSGEILVRVFVLAVEDQMKDWPERDERRISWFSVRRAAALVKERELARLLRTVPSILSGRRQ